jgi:holo-[acyl-carrier protein] synthase
MEEISYCNSHSNPEIHFSGKYAAKEAVKKALLSNDLIEQISLKDIEILNRDNKAPYVVIEHIMDLNYSVSISHEEEYAIAFALVQK